MDTKPSSYTCAMLAANHRDHRISDKPDRTLPVRPMVDRLIATCRAHRPDLLVVLNAPLRERHGRILVDLRIHDGRTLFDRPSYDVPADADLIEEILASEATIQDAMLTRLASL